MQGFFISIEGADNAARRASVKRVVERLRQYRITTIETRDPGGTPFGEKIRTLLLGQPLSQNAEMLVTWAARQQHLDEVIEPALARREVVVTEQFVDWDFALHEGARGITKDRIEALDRWVGGRRPDITFYLDSPLVPDLRPDGEPPLSVPDPEKKFLQEMVRATFLLRIASSPARFRYVDATRPKEEVEGQIDRILDHELALRGYLA